MKVLQINTWFRIGSTGKLVESIFNYSLKKGTDSYVMFGRGKLSKEDKESKKVFKNSSNFEAKANSVLSRFSGIMYGGCYFSTNKAIKIIEKIKPDVIHIHCTNSFIVNNYKLFKYIGNHNYKTVITLHAEYLFTGSCSHSFDCVQWKEGCNKCPRLKQATRSIFVDKTAVAWKKMNNALACINLNNRQVVSVSDWLKEKASISRAFKEDNIEVVGNGINTDIFRYYEDDKNEFAYLKQQHRKIFLYCTPNFSSRESDIKGGHYLLKLAQHFAGEKEILFVVTGANRQNFDFSKYENIKYFGNLVDQDKLAKLYSVCDATLMLSKQETYSLVTAESISCGTKVIGFKSGGPESIALPTMSEFFKFGDLDALIDALKHVERSEIKESVEHYSDEKMCEHYLRIYNELFSK